MLRSVLVFLGILMTGCGFGEWTVSNKPGYTHLIGKRYILKEDLYLQSSIYQKTLSLGRYYPDDGIVNRNLPRVVDRKYIGSKTANGRIEDILSKGSIIEVVDVFHSVSPAGDRIYFICAFEKDGVRSSQLLDTFFIQSSIDGSNGKLPELRKETVEEIGSLPVLGAKSIPNP